MATQRPAPAPSPALADARALSGIMGLISLTASVFFALASLLTLAVSFVSSSPGVVFVLEILLATTATLLILTCVLGIAHGILAWLPRVQQVMTR